MEAADISVAQSSWMKTYHARLSGLCRPPAGNHAVARHPSGAQALEDLTLIAALSVLQGTSTRPRILGRARALLSHCVVGRCLYNTVENQQLSSALTLRLLARAGRICFCRHRQLADVSRTSSAVARARVHRQQKEHSLVM
jgi:hypothetical protein